MEHSSRQADRADSIIVIYDGQCRLCQAAVERLKLLRSRSRLSFLSVQELAQLEAPVVPALFGIPEETLLERMHAVDGEGRLYAGSDAVIRILRTVPGLDIASWMYRLPGMKRICDSAYRYIAKRRYEWFGAVDEGCSVGQCRIPLQSKGQDQIHVVSSEPKQLGMHNGRRGQ